jgi:hypothetical protein
LRIGVVVLVASGTDDSVLAIDHTVFILDHTIALEQGEAISALDALGSFVGQTIRVDLHAQSLLAYSVSLLAFFTTIPSVGQAVVNDTDVVGRFEGLIALPAARIAVFLTSWDPTDFPGGIVVERLDTRSAVTASVDATWSFGLTGVGDGIKEESFLAL